MEGLVGTGRGGTRVCGRHACSDFCPLYLSAWGGAGNWALGRRGRLRAHGDLTLEPGVPLSSSAPAAPRLPQIVRLPQGRVVREQS